MKLSRKKIVLGIILLFLGIAAVWFFVFLGSQERNDITDNTKNLFPFGDIDRGDGGNDSGSQGTIGNDSQTSQETEDITEPESEGPRLRRISDFPTGGYVPLVRVDQKDVSDIEIDEDGNSVETTTTIDVENQYVRYSDIENATVYETELSPNELRQETLVDNFIPNAEYAYFSPDGKEVIFQYWNRDSRSPESYLATLEKIKLTVEPCPYTFRGIELGEDDPDIIGIHTFLNKNPQTQIARTGINSPGNEGSLVTDATITAIKNFQSLYQIDIDGQIGPTTKGKMLEVCNKQQEQAARAAFDALEHKYTISGFFLPQDITSISMGPSSKNVFYLQKDSIGVVGILRNLVDQTKKTIFESPFSEWTSSWNQEKSIELLTKPSYGAKGYSYTLNTENQRYFKSLPERDGLMTLPSPDGTKLLVNETTENGIRSSILVRKTGQARLLTLQTFVDKCTWSDDSVYVYCAVPNALAYGNEYPDVWYQGLEHYQDALWRINTNTMEETLVSDLVNEYGADIDVESMAIDEKGEYLYFLDKDTEFLWSYRLGGF